MTLMTLANRGNQNNNTSGTALAMRAPGFAWLALVGALVIAMAGVIAMPGPALSQDSASEEGAEAAAEIDPEVAAILAKGDVEAGEKFFKNCDQCHDIGEKVKNKQAPHLNGVIGRPAGSVEEFDYSNGMTGAAEKGLVWDEAKIFAYIADPRGYLREYSGNPKAKAKMPVKYKKEQDRADVIAFLKSIQ